MTIEEELALIAQNRSPTTVALQDGDTPSAPPPDDPITATIDPGPATNPVASPPDATPAAQPADPFSDETVPPLLTGLPPLPTNDAGFWDIWGAAWTRSTITGDVNAYANRARLDLALDMFRRLPKDAQTAITSDPQFGRVSNLEAQQRQFRQRIMDAAAKTVATDPTSWGDLPLTQEQFEARLLNDDKAALADAEATLAEPGGGIAAFLGETAREFSRPANVALMPLGGGAGSAAKFILSEALLSGVSSVMALPGQYRAAERLDLPEPNAVQQVATDTALGGAFAGVLVGAAKAIGWGANWASARNQTAIVARPEGESQLGFEAEVAAAEAELTGNRTVAEETRAATGVVVNADQVEPGAPAAAGGRVDVSGLVSPSSINTPGLRYNEDAVLAEIIGVESGGVATAQNPNSSARGLGQFISSTWLTTVRRHRPDIFEGRTNNEVLALRDDPALSIEMTRALQRDNHAALAAAGFDPGPGEMYLAHFAGSGGAVAVMRAAPNTPISGILGARVISANAGIRFNGKRFADFTAGDLRAWANNKMRRAFDPDAARDLPTFTEGGTSRSYTGSGQVTTGDGPPIDVDYEVVDYATLIRAAGDLQPRDRSRVASDAQIADMAARLDPALLLPAPLASNGPPIVGPDNIIESGNGRAMAIARAYERVPDRAQAYRGAIEAAGYAIPDGVTQPVLIARRRSAFTPDQRRQFVIDAQDGGTARMTPTEVARNTARNLQSPILAQLDPSQPITSGANGNFVRAALATLPRTERNAMFDASGALNAFGQRQLREALFARAWSDPDMVALYAEGAANDLKTLIEALDTAAPEWAALRADIEAGLVAPEMDISGHVMDAMRLISAARQVAARDRLPVTKALSEILDAVDMIEGPVAPLTAAMVRKFWPNGRAANADDVAAFLTRYASDARKAGASGGLFDAPTPRDVLVAIDKPAFGDLPDDLGPVRGFATPAAKPNPTLMDEGYDAGAASPEARDVDAEIAAALRAPEPAPEPAPVNPRAEAEQLALRRAADDLGPAFAGLRIDLPDGTTASVADLIDDLDTDTNFDAFIQACGIGNSSGGGGAGATP